jgi:hypothetical protein
VAAINAALGAESAFSLQCRGFVRQYVPAIIKAVKAMPLDQAGFLGFWAGVWGGD